MTQPFPYGLKIYQTLVRSEPTSHGFVDGLDNIFVGESGCGLTHEYRYAFCTHTVHSKSSVNERITYGGCETKGYRP
jgi:hypothetical protein